jgi:hypothetical protein
MGCLRCRGDQPSALKVLCSGDQIKHLIHVLLEAIFGARFCKNCISD